MYSQKNSKILQISISILLLSSLILCQNTETVSQTGSNPGSSTENTISAKTFPFTKLEFPLTLLNYIGLVILILMVILANAGGLGGGGLLIPFLMMFFALPIKECVPIANIFGLIASLIRFILNFNMRHPNNK